MAQAPRRTAHRPENRSCLKELPARAPEAYYSFTMGHIYEQQFEATSSPELRHQVD